MHKWILGLIIVVAFILRVSFLSSFPQGFSPDEASFGYDAYSILHTGRDQWGHIFPIVLESFGDFKLPLYTYITIPFVSIGDLNIYSVRLPNALIGSLAVFVTYLLAKELLRGKKHVNEISLISAFLLAVSPWHVMMSRGAFEANLTTFLMPLGIFLFLKGLTNHKLLILSSIVFGLNTFSYHSARFVTPFIFVSLIAFWYKDFLVVPVKFKLTFILIFVMFILVMGYSFRQGAGTRVSDISVFAGAMEEAAGPRLSMINSGVSEPVAKLINNKFVIASKKFGKNYTTYFSPRFLFTNGPNEATYGMVPGEGVLYTVEALFLFGFMVWLYKNFRSKEGWFLIFWLLVAPIPASLTQGVGFSANRALTMIPAIIIISAIGFVFIVHSITRKFSIKPKYLYSCFVVIILIQTIQIAQRYLFPNVILAKSMLYGRIEAMDKVVNKNKVIISRSLSEPHIYVAFENKWDPLTYQNNSVDWRVYRYKNIKFLDQMDPYSLGKYTFTSVEGKEVDDFLGYVVVAKPEEFPDGTIPDEVIYYPNGEEALFIVNYE